MSTIPHSTPEVVLETPMAGGLPAVVHPDWSRRWRWLIQGITTRGEAEDPFDLGWFTGSATGDIQRRWGGVLEELGPSAMVLSPQPHGSAVRVHDPLPPGLHRTGACDGHLVAGGGPLAVVTVADCVPVWIVDPERRLTAVLHAGWRGIAAGVLERGIAVLGERFGSSCGDLHVHAGPSICGECYEVGPEVHEALGGPVPPGPRPVDLKAALARRAVACGVPPASVSVSGHCTLHGDLFFSHRGGDSARQAAFTGIAG